MAIDQRILDKFQEEFAASKNRAAVIQKEMTGLNERLQLLQANLSGESGIQVAINEVLVALNEAPLD